MEGTVLTKPALPGNGKMKMHRFETRIDVTLNRNNSYLTTPCRYF